MRAKRNRRHRRKARYLRHPPFSNGWGTGCWLKALASTRLFSLPSHDGWIDFADRRDDVIGVSPGELGIQ